MSVCEKDFLETRRHKPVGSRNGFTMLLRCYRLFLGRPSLENYTLFGPYLVIFATCGKTEETTDFMLGRPTPSPRKVVGARIAGEIVEKQVRPPVPEVGGTMGYIES